MSLYNSQELHDVMTQIDQQLLRYFTACENEQHHLNVVEDAITGVLVPRVEELLAEDNMNGGEHSMSRKRNQGQMGLFYNGSAYVTNYQFARVFCATLTARREQCRSKTRKPFRQRAAGFSA